MRLLSSNKKIVENLFTYLKTPFEMECNCCYHSSSEFQEGLCEFD